MIHELDRLWIGAAIVWCAAVTTGPAQGAVQRTGDGIPSDITGLYRCEGPGASGVCVVRQRGDAYQLRWRTRVDTAGVLRQGIGLRHGAALAVSWQGGKTSGLTLYTVKPGPKLVGKSCALAGDPRVIEDTLSFEKPLAELPPPREWHIGETVLVNYSGDQYWYTATIAKIDGARYFICFDDEGRFWVDSSRIAEDDIQPGDRVLAKLTKKPVYRPATVTERQDRMIRVAFEDGAEVATTIHFVKVLRPRE